MNLDEEDGMAWDNKSTKRLIQLYKERRKSMDFAVGRLRTIIRNAVASIEDKSLVRAELRSVRVKSVASVARKAAKNNWDAEDALSQCRDLVGSRVVCNNLEDVYRFVELLRESLPFPDRIEVRDQIAKPKSTGYRGIHVKFRIDVGKHSASRDFIPCEVQVRSRLQDAWAELSHDDIYRRKDRRKRLKLACSTWLQRSPRPT